MDAFDKMQESLERLRRILGTLLDHVLSIDVRQSHLSPFGGKRHRLAFWIRTAETAIATRGELPIIAAHELAVTASLFDTWQVDPLWDEILKTLADPTSYPHAVHTLLVAGSFERSKVRLNPTRENIRTPDLFVDYGTAGMLAVEVKTPLDLQQPTPSLEGNKANKLVLRLMEKADDQLQAGIDGPGHSSMLAIGAFHLGRDDTRNLERGTRSYFTKKAARRPHLLGIMFSNFGVLFDAAPEVQTGGRMIQRDATSTRGFVRLTLAPSPRYTGSIPTEGFHGPDPDIENAAEVSPQE